jgi:hypothetical protein
MCAQGDVYRPRIRLERQLVPAAKLACGTGTVFDASGALLDLLFGTNRRAAMLHNLVLSMTFCAVAVASAAPECPPGKLPSRCDSHR